VSYNSFHNGIVFSIYKITNILNGKAYIGFDSRFPNRINKHLKDSLKKTKSVLCEDLKYYGERVGINNAFTFECLYQSKDPIHCLKFMEPYFIELYNTHYIYGHGYNMTFGGDGIISPRMVKIVQKYKRKQKRNSRKKEDSKKRLQKFREKRFRSLDTFIFEVKIPSKYII
jgi:group I intron endonuclease